MHVIARHESCWVYDSANELAITIGSTSKIVDRIEAPGYCRRLANPDDRRSSLIELTLAGKHLLAQATVIFDDELERRLGAVVSTRALQEFSAILARLRSAGRQIAATEKTP
jgi:DNA-binding MarR family transcriptional regulator